MKVRQVVITCIFAAIGFISPAQMKFSKGYIVTNKHEKIDCLIRNSRNAESSMNYEYKLNDASDIEKIELAKFEEFGLANETKFIRALVKIDISADRIRHLKDTINSPEWDEGHVYLKVLFDGKLASLYSYYDEGKNQFFYAIGNSAIEPLYYKEFNVEITPGIVEKTLVNHAYREQLRQSMPCNNQAKINKLAYTRKDLINYFADYNTNQGASSIVTQHTKTHKDNLRLKIGTSLNRIDLQTQDFSASSNISFSPEYSTGFGAEIEYILPFNNYKWSVFAESNLYSYYTGDSENSFDSQTTGSVINYKTIEYPLGVNFYLNLNENQRLFLRGAYVFNSLLNQSHVTFKSDYPYELSTAPRLYLGAGFNHKKLGIELRCYSKQNITQNLYKRGSELSQISFRLTYVLFQSGKK